MELVICNGLAHEKCDPDCHHRTPHTQHPAGCGCKDCGPTDCTESDTCSESGVEEEASCGEAEEEAQ
jgi:hypothetical protein